jgi:hypothetical protein
MLVCVQLIDNYINVWIQCQGHLWEQFIYCLFKKINME